MSKQHPVFHYKDFFERKEAFKYIYIVSIFSEVLINNSGLNILKVMSVFL